MAPAERPLEGLTGCRAQRGLVGFGVTDVRVKRNAAVAERMGLDGRQEYCDLGGKFSVGRDPCLGCSFRPHVSCLTAFILPAFEFPRGEAPDMHVEFVEARVDAVSGELNLELLLVLPNGQAAYQTRGTDTHVRSGARFGSLPLRIASRAVSRRMISSGMG